MDPPIGNVFLPDDRGKIGTEQKYVSQTRLFQGGFVDFNNSPPFVKKSVDWITGPERLSMLDDLIHYWLMELPPGFTVASPSLLSLCYYPFKIAAAEWTNFANSMDYAVRDYEYSLEGSWLTELTVLESALRCLHSWRRRSVEFEKSVRFTSDYIKNNKSANSDVWSGLAHEYQHIARQIDSSGRRFEAMVPIVASLVQIAEGRRSFQETTNISRLTYLALVFVPLTFVSGLFGMAGDVAPGAKRFWVYFTVAVPLLVVTFGAMICQRLLPSKRSLGGASSNC